MNTFAALAQLVEQGTENPCVLGSIPRRGKFFVYYRILLFLSNSNHKKIGAICCGKLPRIDVCKVNLINFVLVYNELIITNAFLHVHINYILKSKL